jgi:tRNA A-37 threonylcarbamoyl transferase component Bud32
MGGLVSSGALLAAPVPQQRLETTHEPATARPPPISRSRRRRRPSGEPPPLPRTLNTSGRYWLAATGLVLVIWFAALANSRTNDYIVTFDQTVLGWIVGLRSPILTNVMLALHALGSHWTIRILFWSTILVLVLVRRFRHLFVFLGTTLLVIAASTVMSYLLLRPRPLGIEILGDWTMFANPSRPVAAFTGILVGMLYTLVPQGRARQSGKWGVVCLVAALVAARLYLAVDSPSDVLMATIIGVTVPLVAFRLLVPNEVFPVTYRPGRSAHLDVGGRRGEAIHQALEEQLGINVLGIEPFGLSGSAGSTPLRVRVKGDPDSYLFAKLYAQTHLRADRWYKLGRTLLYGRLEDEKPFNTVRRLVQQEDYALQLLYHRADVRSPEPFGVVAITPEREYLIVTEFFDNAKEIGEVDVDDAIIDDGLRTIRRLWDAGLAHRDIKPANLLVRDGKVHLIDVFFSEVQPSPWRQAVDLANMMLVLACRSTAQRVYDRALRQFSVEEISEAFAATRGITMPSQLRRMMRTQGRDLHAEFLRLLPEPPARISIQRWSLHRVTLMITVLLIALGTLGLAVFNFVWAGLL